MTQINLYKEIRIRKNLRNAWRKVRESCRSSEDLLIKGELSKFKQKEDRNLDKIYEKLLRERYAFHPSRGIISQKKKKKPRPIVIGIIEDRIVQRSILNVLEGYKPIKNLVNSPGSFGGVIKGGVAAAIRHAILLIKDNCRFYIKTDIKEYFRNIPRQEALNKISSVLPDNTFNAFLDIATQVELGNLNVVYNNRDLFPTYSLGVAQGCCLSPFLGNILLSEFDYLMNQGECSTIRYIDDILILGPNQESVWKAFKAGIRLLNRLDLDVYHPSDRSGKAKQGTTDKKFNYLGCNISPSFIQPDRKSKQRLLRKIHILINQSKKAINNVTLESPTIYHDSFITTLYNIHNLIHAWGSSYKFCNAEVLFRNIDQGIDLIISEYIQYYRKIYKSKDDTLHRRIFGLQLLIDCKSRPILPIMTTDKINAIFED